MDIPSLSDRPVGSRFVSQDEIDLAKQRKEEQWKAAYARLGQDPPPQQQEDVYDGRSLAEKLAANRIAKQEEWEEKNKLATANQFRALEEDEIQFLDSIRERQEAVERQRKEEDGQELKQFKQAVAARANTLNSPPPIPGSGQPAKPKPQPQPARPTQKKDAKRPLKGVLVKKKAKAVSGASKSDAKDDPPKDTESQPPPKRRRVTEPSP